MHGGDPGQQTGERTERGGHERAGRWWGRCSWSAWAGRSRTTTSRRWSGSGTSAACCSSATTCRARSRPNSLPVHCNDSRWRRSPPMPLFVAVDQEGGEVRLGSLGRRRSLPRRRSGAGGTRRRRARSPRRSGVELLRGGRQHGLRARSGHGLRGGDREPLLRGRPEPRRAGWARRPSRVSRRRASSPRPSTSRTTAPRPPDSHVGLPVVDHDVADRSDHDLPPFRAAVEAGVPMVMVGHLRLPGDRPRAAREPLARGHGVVARRSSASRGWSSRTTWRWQGRRAGARPRGRRSRRSRLGRICS